MASAFIQSFVFILTDRSFQNIFWYFRMRKLVEIFILNRMVVQSLLLVNFERLCVDLKFTNFEFYRILAREREALESSFFASNVLFDLDLQRVTLKNLKSNRHGKALKGSPDSSHFIFEINVGIRRIRHRTTLKFTF